MLLILLSTTISLFASDFTYEGVNYTIIDEATKTCKTKEGTSTSPGNSISGNLTIPQTVYNDDVAYTVVLIGKASFASSGLTSVVLPQSVTEIGLSAFIDCKDLIAINLPNSLKIINGMAFKGCINLISIDIPDTVTDLGPNTFDGCSSLSAVRLSNSITVLNAYMFYGCVSLKQIKIPKSVTSLGYGNDGGCFMGCTQLTSIEIPSSVSFIGNDTFVSCRALKSIDISSVKNLYNRVFSGCSNLETIKLSKSLGHIPYGTFHDCTSLTSIDIPGGTSIGVTAFGGCSNLKIIKLPISLRDIEKDAFFGCSKLNEVYSYAVAPPTCELDLFRDIYLGNAYLHVPAGSKEAYSSANGWRKFGNIIDDLPVAASNIYLNRVRFSVEQKATYQLTATVDPANTTDELVWSSSDESVATVSETGLVTAVSVGSATITATCGTVSATCEAIVTPISAKEIVLNTNSITIDVAGKYQLTAAVNPEGAADKTVTWSSSNPNVATVSESGLITANTIGSAIIYAQCGYVSSSCDVVVLPKSVSLDYQNVELDVNGTKQLKATVLPETSTNKTVIWESTNTDVVTVSEEGLVTAIAPGVAVVTATCDEGSAFCIFTIAQPDDVPEISLSIKLGVSQTLGISAIVSPNDTAGTIEWSSSNTEIAEVSEDGIVRAKAKGAAIITATCGELSTSIIFIIEEFSGISEVNADNSSDVVVYNLQGIRLNVSTREEFNNLPAGYYIVNNRVELIK